jgi:hypothetical protein
MGKRDLITIFNLALEILSTFSLVFLILVISSDWNPITNSVGVALDSAQSGGSLLAGKGLAIYLFIVTIAGNIYLIPLCWFPTLSLRGKTLYERFTGQKDNRDSLNREFPQLFLTVGKTGVTWTFAILSWQSMLAIQHKRIPYQGKLILGTIIGTALILLGVLIYYVIRKRGQP